MQKRVWVTYSARAVKFRFFVCCAWSTLSTVKLIVPLQCPVNKKDLYIHVHVYPTPLSLTLWHYLRVLDGQVRALSPLVDVLLSSFEKKWDHLDLVFCFTVCSPDARWNWNLRPRNRCLCGRHRSRLSKSCFFLLKFMEMEIDFIKTPNYFWWFVFLSVAIQVFTLGMFLLPSAVEDSLFLSCTLI